MKNTRIPQLVSFAFFTDMCHLKSCIISPAYKSSPYPWIMLYILTLVDILFVKCNPYDWGTFSLLKVAQNHKCNSARNLGMLKKLHKLHSLCNNMKVHDLMRKEYWVGRNESIHDIVKKKKALSVLVLLQNKRCSYGALL